MSVEIVANLFQCGLIHRQITLMKHHPETALQWLGSQSSSHRYKRHDLLYLTELLQTDLFGEEQRHYQRAWAWAGECAGAWSWALTWASCPSSQTTIDEGGNERSPRELLESRGTISASALENKRSSLHDIEKKKGCSIAPAMLLQTLSSNHESEQPTKPFCRATQEDKNNLQNTEALGSEKRVANKDNRELLKQKSGATLALLSLGLLYFADYFYLLALLYRMASLVVQVHDLNSESATTSPEQSSTPSSEYRAVTNVYSPKPKQRSCLCSPTTHEGSFRCRLHRSSSGYWGRKPMPTPTTTPPRTPPPTPTPTPSDNGVVLRRTDQSAQAPSNIADHASCTCGLSSESPTTERLFRDGVSSK